MERYLVVNLESYLFLTNLPYTGLLKCIISRGILVSNFQVE